LHLQNQLTICSVSFNSKSCVELNWLLTKRLNGANNTLWVIVENSETSSKEKISLDDERFKVLEGVPRNLEKNSDSFCSYHHAAGLNKALKIVTSRYVLFLDPDFFIIRPGWIKDVLAYMQSCKLSLFGAPFYPSHRTKYRYFPCVQCLFVDLERISKTELDFMPEIDELASVRSLKFKILTKWLLTQKRPHDQHLYPNATFEMACHAFWDRLMALFLCGYSRILDVGSSRDVGYRIYRSFFNDNNQVSECLVPAWHNPLYTRSELLKHAIKKFIIRWFIPERLSSYPKRKNYSSSRSFSDFGLPDLISLGWEEYLWQGEPFGCHIRGLFQGKKSVEFNSLFDILERCVGFKIRETEDN